MVIKLKSQWETERPFNLLSWGHWFTFANFLLALVFSIFYLSAENLPSTLIGWIYLASTWLGHFAFLAMACFILTIFPVVILFPYKRHIRGVSAIMASLFQLYLFLDVLAYQGLGYHLTASSFSQIREVEDVYVAMMGEGYFVMVLGVFLAILGYQFVASNLTWKRIHTLQSFKHRYRVAGFLIGCFVTGHLLHLWGDATLNTDVAKTQSVFPAHYPLTAKTLLARYELIDLDDYQLALSGQAKVESANTKIRASQAVACEIDDKPNLHVYLFPVSDKSDVKDWLDTQNIRYQANSNLSLSNDLSSLTYNLTTGLPALYKNSEQLLPINKAFDQQKIFIKFFTEGFDKEITLTNLAEPRAFIFYHPNQEEVFYRTDVFLVGFDEAPDAAFTPQNVLASYIHSTLKCSEYVNANLIDRPFSDFDNDHIAVHFADEFFYFVYKDNAVLFKQGNLVSNKTYSSNRKVSDTVDIFVLKKAIAKLTKLRQ